MERAYLDDLRRAYERFFAAYTDAPVLTLDTDGIDIVRDAAARAEVIARVKTALKLDGYQLPLADLTETPAAPSSAASRGRRLGDFQQFHRVLDREKGFLADLYLNYIGLTEEVGEIGRVLKHAWRRQEQARDQVGNRQEAQDLAISAARADLQEELADALAFLLKMANDAQIDLESAYLKKMAKNITRTWDTQPTTGG
jgi:NTP pyrophosphatase (non-canonical NTP hydrolase)